MSLKNRLAKLLIDPSFRHPGILRAVIALDDRTGIDLMAFLKPFKMLPASRRLFTRSFAHFITGEAISLRAVTALQAIAPDEKIRNYLVVQAGEEERHHHHFSSRLAAFGMMPDNLSAYVADNFGKFGERIDRAIEDGDFVGGLIGNNVVVEGMAILMMTLGGTAMRENSDEIAKFMDYVLEDERHHLRFGERTLKRLAEEEKIDIPRAEEFIGEMWATAALAVDEIPDVLDALDLDGTDLKARMKAFYRERLTPAGLAHALG
jgi:ribonucleotide reductase beta subunit family protein with ferritin-like domain